MPSEKLSNVLIQYLKRCGESDKKIADCHFGTWLYHDLGIYGEAAEDYLEVLANEYQVEFADFQFDRYFPPEFEGKTAISRALIWNFPYIWKLFRPKVEAGQYLPITLEMIEQVILRKKWISCPSA